MKNQTFDLERFINAHSANYQVALNEIRTGRKESHWMWYIFPQVRGLGKSYNSAYYGIDGIEEAKAYIADPILRSHLHTISEALLDLAEKDVRKIFDAYDVKKLKSCMTLFAIADPDNGIYQAVLDKYFEGRFDDRTVDLLTRQIRN